MKNDLINESKRKNTSNHKKIEMNDTSSDNMNENDSKYKKIK